jgi:HK97 family phage major capsid protein
VNVERLRARRKEITDAQTAIVSAAEKEERELEDDEKSEFRKLQDEFQKVHDQVTTAETALRNAQVTQSTEGIRPDPTPDGAAEKEEPETRDLGSQFVESAQYRATKQQGFRGNYSTGVIELRTLIDSGSGSAGDLLVTDYRPGIRPISLRRLVVADLIPSSNVDATSVTYFEEQTFTNAAAATSEGAVKQESALVFNQVTDSVRKLAHWIPVTDEMLDDVSALRGFINQRLVVGLQLEEEDQLLNGDGNAPNISGILDRTGLQTEIDIGAANAADSVYGMVTAIREDNYEPNGMVVHPLDWGSTDFRLSKDANEQYLAGGPFTGQYGNGGIVGDVFWGLRVVVTAAIAQGTVLVGDFNQAQVFRKQGITVEASNSHSDYFIYNKTAIRAEERLALAVYAPGAFGVVDLTP